MLEIPCGQTQMKEKELKKLKKENKILVIGVILLAIYLVAVSVYEYIDFKECENSSGNYVIGYETFNSKFVFYAGNNVRGTNVITLISNVITSNANNEDSRQIYITTTNISVTGVSFGTNGSNDFSELTKLKNVISLSHRYTVELGYSDNGLVNKITITDNTSTDNDNITNDYIDNTVKLNNF